MNRRPCAIEHQCLPWRIEAEPGTAVARVCRRKAALAGVQTGRKKRRGRGRRASEASRRRTTRGAKSALQRRQDSRRRVRVRDGPGLTAHRPGQPGTTGTGRQTSRPVAWPRVAERCWHPCTPGERPCRPIEGMALPNATGVSPSLAAAVRGTRRSDDKCKALRTSSSGWRVRRGEATGAASRLALNVLHSPDGTMCARRPPPLATASGRAWSSRRARGTHRSVERGLAVMGSRGRRAKLRPRRVLKGPEITP